MGQEFLHETILRGREAIEKFAKFHIAISGIGVVGSNLAENLVRQGFRKLTIIDFDRIEEHNVGPQNYYSDAVGMLKVPALQNQLYRIAETPVVGINKELANHNIRGPLRGVDLVIDSLDRSAAREAVRLYCQVQRIACLHIGLNEDYAEVIWNEQYRVPKETDVDVCDYPLSRNIAMLAVVIASEVIVNFVLLGERKSYCITLKDFKIERMEV